MFKKERRSDFTDVSTVESQRNDLTAEEFPEGPYGSNLVTETLGKSTPWRKDQRSPNSFRYENRSFHAGRSRVYPAAHETYESHEDEGEAYGQVLNVYEPLEERPPDDNEPPDPRE